MDFVVMDNAAPFGTIINPHAKGTSTSCMVYSIYGTLWFIGNVNMIQGHESP